MKNTAIETFQFLNKKKKFYIKFGTLIFESQKKNPSMAKAGVGAGVGSAD